MKFKIWNEKLGEYVDESDFLIRSNGNVYYISNMDGELVRDRNCVVHWITEIVDNND